MTGYPWSELRREMERILGWPPGAFDPDPLGIFQAIQKDTGRVLRAFEQPPTALDNTPPQRAL